MTIKEEIEWTIRRIEYACARIAQLKWDSSRAADHERDMHEHDIRLLNERLKVIGHDRPK